MTDGHRRLYVHGGANAKTYDAEVREALPEYMPTPNDVEHDPAVLAKNIDEFRERAVRSKVAVAEMAERLDRLHHVKNWHLTKIRQNRPLDTFPPPPDAEPVDVPAPEDGATNTGA